jgi:hypothetical protein
MAYWNGTFAGVPPTEETRSVMLSAELAEVRISVYRAARSATPSMAATPASRSG